MRTTIIGPPGWPLAFEEVTIYQPGCHPCFGRRQIVTGVISNHETILRVEAKLCGDLDKVAGLGLTVATILEAGDQHKMLRIDSSPTTTRLNQSLRENRIRRQHERNLSLLATFQQLSNLRDPLNAHGQRGKSGVDKALKSLAQNPFILLQVTGQKSKQALLVAALTTLGFEEQMNPRAHGALQRPIFNQIATAGMIPCDIAGDERTHFDLQQGSVKVKEYGTK